MFEKTTQSLRALRRLAERVSPRQARPGVMVSWRTPAGVEHGVVVGTEGANLLVSVAYEKSLRSDPALKLYRDEGLSAKVTGLAVPGVVMDIHRVPAAKAYMRGRMTGSEAEPYVKLGLGLQKESTDMFKVANDKLNTIRTALLEGSANPQDKITAALKLAGYASSRIKVLQDDGGDLVYKEPGAKFGEVLLKGAFKGRGKSVKAMAKAISVHVPKSEDVEEAKKVCEMCGCDMTPEMEGKMCEACKSKTEVQEGAVPKVGGTLMWKGAKLKVFKVVDDAKNDDVVVVHAGTRESEAKQYYYHKSKKQWMSSADMFKAKYMKQAGHAYARRTPNLGQDMMVYTGEDLDEGRTWDKPNIHPGSSGKPYSSGVDWKKALKRDEEQLKQAMADLKALKAGGRVSNLTLQGAEENIQGLKMAIAAKKKLIKAMGEGMEEVGVFSADERETLENASTLAQQGE